jgi:hypothetical protein
MKPIISNWVSGRRDRESVHDGSHILCIMHLLCILAFDSIQFFFFCSVKHSVQMLCFNQLSVLDNIV